jgi:hypothetical protein
MPTMQLGLRMTFFKQVYPVNTIHVMWLLEVFRDREDNKKKKIKKLLITTNAIILEDIFKHYHTMCGWVGDVTNSVMIDANEQDELLSLRKGEIWL